MPEYKDSFVNFVENSHEIEMSTGEPTPVTYFNYFNNFRIGNYYDIKKRLGQDNDYVFTIEDRPRVEDRTFIYGIRLGYPSGSAVNTNSLNSILSNITTEKFWLIEGIWITKEQKNIQDPKTQPKDYKYKICINDLVNNVNDYKFNCFYKQHLDIIAFIVLHTTLSRHFNPLEENDKKNSNKRGIVYWDKKEIQIYEKISLEFDSVKNKSIKCSRKSNFAKNIPFKDIHKNGLFNS